MGRIFLFGSAVVSVLLLTLIYAIVSGQYVAGKPVASPTQAESVAASPSVAVSSSAVPSASSTVAASASEGASPSGAAVVVPIANFSFGANLTVAAGTTVTFKNNDAVKHTATNGTNGTAASGALFDLALEAGASGSYTFAAAGTYQVTCIVHPTMNVTITVR